MCTLLVNIGKPTFTRSFASAAVTLLPILPPTVPVNFRYATFTRTFASAAVTLLPILPPIVPVNFWYPTFTRTLAVVPFDLPSDSSSEFLPFHLH